MELFMKCLGKAILFSIKIIFMWRGTVVGSVEDNSYSALRPPSSSLGGE